MRLYAISDLHVSHPANLQSLQGLKMDHEAGLILAGDIAESAEELRATLVTLKQQFGRLFWVPGNHELWSMPGKGSERGVQKYLAMVEVCRAEGVFTPEDPIQYWDVAGQKFAIVPLFLLYDYTFRPLGMSLPDALLLAEEQHSVCSDEVLLHPDPYSSREAWCHARVQVELSKLQALPRDVPLILVNHFPLMREHAVLPRIPMFSMWCGTEQTADWHKRFNVKVVVYGHLHMRRTMYRDGVRFEEVSLGYPRQFKPELGLRHYLREILPGQAVAA